MDKTLRSDLIGIILINDQLPCMNTLNIIFLAGTELAFTPISEQTKYNWVEETQIAFKKIKILLNGRIYL